MHLVAHSLTLQAASREELRSLTRIRLQQKGNRDHHWFGQDKSKSRKWTEVRRGSHRSWGCLGLGTWTHSGLDTWIRSGLDTWFRSGLDMQIRSGLGMKIHFDLGKTTRRIQSATAPELGVRLRPGLGKRADWNTTKHLDMTRCLG